MSDENVKTAEDLEFFKKKMAKGLRISEAYIKSTDDDRVVNNVVRHEYRVLTDEEKEQMKAIKDMGLDFLTLLESLGDSRELSLAKTKIEEAVMWSVKSVTK